MVEYSLKLNALFYALSNATRRDILKRVAKTDLNVSEIAKFYNLTLAGISKHLRVLEQSGLIVKKRNGKERFVRMEPKMLLLVQEFLQSYSFLWEERIERINENLRGEMKNLKK